jgi:hypothetical protein
MSQEVLTGHLRNFTIVYLDDIIVYSTNHEDHIKHIQLVFERLQIRKCAPEKCHLGEREIVYLGHVVSTQGNQPQQLHLRQIQGAPHQRTAVPYGPSWVCATGCVTTFTGSPTSRTH